MNRRRAGDDKNDDDKVFPPGMGRLVAVLVGLVLLACLGPLARFTSDQDFKERDSVRERGIEACAALAKSSAGLPEVTAAVDAFEADKQLVLSVAARQAESRLQGGTESDATVSDLARDCDATYSEGA